MRVIKLEDLHLKNTEILKSFCSYFDLNFSNSMKQSTYFGKKWWGDTLSVKYLNGVNPNFKNSLDNKFYFNNDVIYMEKLLKNFNLKYGYKKKFPNNNPVYFLPLKCEIILALDYLRKLKLLYFLILLNNFIKRIFKKNLSKHVDYPDMLI